MLPTKIVIIGAGSAIFGLNTVAALLRSERLRGSQLALVDRNAETLALIARLAGRLNREWQADMIVTTHTHHADALEDAEFVVSAIEVPPREKLWQSDYEIPLKYGLRQPYAENGGPGGFAHAARNIGPVLQIVHDMELVCPDAWFINFTNPMIRICDAVARYSDIKVVGLCHQIGVGYAMVGRALAQDFGLEIAEGFTSAHASPVFIPGTHRMAEQALARFDIKAAGLNHFTWMLDVRDKQTGEDLYPLFAERWAALDPSFEPLTRRVYKAFDLFPIPGDEHLCEYLPWVSDPLTKPWEKYDLSLYEWDLWDQMRRDGHGDIARMGEGDMSIDALRDADSEGALELIEAMAGAGNHYHLAVNLPNQGYITNLPQGAIVEVPGLVAGAGVLGVGVGLLPEPIAELCRREITVAQLGVDAAVNGDRQAALQCLLLDPVVTDLDVAQQILDDYLETYREYLPQFW
ncbi:MAG: alpha-galactosidase [Chloroflexota bacterium]|nr:MAG: alpha-galactosidase [Chloroflexota bacterium]